MATLFCDASAIVKRYASEVWCSADCALNSAPLAEGLAVDDPNTHP